MAARRRHSNRRRRRGSFGFLYRLLSVLVICGVIVVALTLFFRVDTVVVTGTQRYTQQEVIDATGIKTGDNLFLMNKYDVAQNIVGELPYIEEIRINRKLPDTLLIQVEECGTPLALVQDGSAWLISSTGKIVDQKTAAEATDYGTIDGCELLAPSVGSSIALKTEYATQQSQPIEAAGGAGGQQHDGRRGCHPPGGWLHAGHGLSGPLYRGDALWGGELRASDADPGDRREPAGDQPDRHHPPQSRR